MTFEKWWRQHGSESRSRKALARRAWKASIRRARKICHLVAGDCAPSAEEGGYDQAAHDLAHEILGETKK